MVVKKEGEKKTLEKKTEIVTKYQGLKIIKSHLVEFNSQISKLIKVNMKNRRNNNL